MRDCRLQIADCGFTSLARERIVGRLCLTLSSSRRFTETPYNVSYAVAYQFLTHCGVIVSGLGGLAVRPDVLQRSNVGL